MIICANIHIYISYDKKIKYGNATFRNSQAH